MTSDYERRARQRIHKFLRVSRTIIIPFYSQCLRNHWYLEGDVHLEQRRHDQLWHCKELAFPTCRPPCLQVPGYRWTTHPGCKQGDCMPLSRAIASKSTIPSFLKSVDQEKDYRPKEEALQSVIDCFLNQLSWCDMTNGYQLGNHSWEEINKKNKKKSGTQRKVN